MQPHQKRVVDEKIDLDWRLSRLKDFIDTGTIFASLPQDEKDRLIKQSAVMQEYSKILEARIAAFK